MGKFVMPTAKAFFKRKRIYEKKKDPVWVYLEREMRENESKKPYNYKVGAWLRFLKDLRYYFFCEAKRKYKRLFREAGPPWYYELSFNQRIVLSRVKEDIHKDLLQRKTYRTTHDIWELGITLKFDRATLFKCINDAMEDPGIFFWYLFETHYKMPPSELRLYYDMNAMIMISAMVFLDYEGCVRTFETILRHPEKPSPAPHPAREAKKYWEPKCRYGVYLQKIYVPLVTNNPDEIPPDRCEVDLGYRIRLRSDRSYENLQKDHSFIKKRLVKNKADIFEPRVANYKFWECPAYVHNRDPKLRDYVMKLKIFRLRPRHTYQKFKFAPVGNEMFNLGTVTYIGNKPRFILNTVCILPTGNSPINGGQVRYGKEFITLILGHFRTPDDTQYSCERHCRCIANWESAITDYVHKSKCTCKHNYDFEHEPVKDKSFDKCFHPATRFGEHWFDQAKIYRLDTLEEKIKEELRRALQSETTLGDNSGPCFDAKGFQVKEILAALLADVSHTPLIIPHLPKANLLNNLQEWVRKRVFGEKLTPREHKQLALKAERRWLDLKHMDFRARSCKIPFTETELDHMNWSHRHLIQDLYHALLENFTLRNRQKQVEQTRLFWPTMHFEHYPSKTFLEIFYTYMPGTIRDSYLFNPYSPNGSKRIATSCPLNLSEGVRVIN